MQFAKPVFLLMRFYVFLPGSCLMLVNNLMKSISSGEEKKTYIWQELISPIYSITWINKPEEDDQFACRYRDQQFILYFVQKSIDGCGKDGHKTGLQYLQIYLEEI